MSSRKRILDAMMALDKRPCTSKSCPHVDTEHEWPYCDEAFISQVSWESNRYAQAVDRGAWRERAVWATALLAVFAAAVVYVPHREVVETRTITVTKEVSPQSCLDALTQMGVVLGYMEDMLAERVEQENARVSIDEALNAKDWDATQAAMGNWGASLGQETDLAEAASQVDLSPAAQCMGVS